MQRLYDWEARQEWPVVTTAGTVIMLITVTVPEILWRLVF